MRYLSSLMPIALLFWSQVASAQRHDYMWPLGLGPGWSDYNFFLDFNQIDTPKVTLRTDTMSTGTYCASYCDADGKILLYSNGLWILNRDGNLVENSTGLNPTFEGYTYSYPGGQSGFFLERPGDPNTVYFVSTDFGPHPAQEWPYVAVGQNLVVATIDLAANGGAGKVTEKNRALLSGTLMAPAACRHANGRDWWVLVSDADQNRHYRLLLHPGGFSAPEVQHIGTKPNPVPNIGQGNGNLVVGNCFSPQGNYYADINDYLGFSIFSFDRCSGLLSAERRVDYPPPTVPGYFRNGPGKGAAFSPDESLFYKTTTFQMANHPALPLGSVPYLLQYDLSSPKLSTAVDTINTPVLPTLSNVTFEHFYGAELAPDGRIYVVHEGVSYCTVQYPNVRGKGCKFAHDRPFFGVTIGQAIPCFPNYRLGPLDGSPCDTLGLDNLPVADFRADDTLGALSRYFYDLSHHEPAAWHWEFGDGGQSAAQSPLHAYAAPGVYEVCLTVTNAYGSDTRCRKLYLGALPTGEPGIAAGLKVWPNPATGAVRLSLPSGSDWERVRVHTAAGALVRAFGGVTEGEDLTFDVGGWPAGVYFVSAMSRAHGVLAARLVVQRE